MRGAGTAASTRRLGQRRAGPGRAARGARAACIGAVLVALAAGGAAPAGAPADAPDGRYREFGDAGGFANVIPPGQDATLTPAELQAVTAAVAAEDPAGFPPHYADQWQMYASLVQGAPTLTDAELGRYFKDASFGVRDDDIERAYNPAGNEDVTVVRDASFGVPHIFGRTRYATMFAQGYTTAEDRLVFLDVLRHVGRGRLSELIGLPGASNDNSTLATAPYTEADLQQQLDALRESGDEGAAAVEDVEAYADGVNAFIAEVAADPAKLPAEYGLLGRTPQPWQPTDTVAVAANIGGIFGKGGGREIVNWCGLQAYEERVGPERAREVFDVVHFADDPSAPVSAAEEFPYETGERDATDPAAVPPIDCASLRDVGGSAGPDEGGGLGAGSGAASLPPTIAGVLAALAPSANAAMSNAVVVGGEHTASGRPIAVFGPQVGYNNPALLVEKDVHGPGIDARGVAFIGTDVFVQLGRGRDYAFSATSSGADNIDTFVLRLCDPAGGPPTPDATGYEHEGACTPIETFEHVVSSRRDIAPSSEPVTLAWKIERAPDYGPITQRGALTDGTPIAVAVRRSTYLAEPESVIGFKRLNDPEYMRDGVDAFRTATSEGIDFTFNWFYVDADDIAYQHSCKCPLRADGADLDLPTWGTGEWDWTGYLAPDDQPHDVNPDRGYLTSWNNKQAPGFRGSDAQFSWGPVHRVQLLDARLDAAIEGGAMDRADVVRLVTDAATADLRGEQVLPQLLEVMQGAPPPGTDERVLAARERLEVWMTTGAYRRDLDGDGAYDDPVGPAIMDTWWDVLVRDTYERLTDGAVTALELPIDDSPRGHGGSSWLDGGYSLVRADLDAVLAAGGGGDDNDDEALTRWFEQPLCGRDRPACAAVLWESLAAAVRVLEAPAPPEGYPDSDSFGTPVVEEWKRVPADDEIRFDTLVAGMLPMHWVNRPTFQQVVAIESGARSSSRRETARDRRDGGSDSPSIALVVGAGLLAGAGIGIGISLARRRRRG